MKMQRQSKNYVGTFHYESAADMLELERIRKAIKVVNYQLSHFNSGPRRDGYNRQFYVKCAGRLGKNNPNAYKYRGFARFGEEREEGRAGYVRLEDATRMDAYVYERGEFALR